MRATCTNILGRKLAACMMQIAYMRSFKLFRLSAIPPFRCSNHRIAAPVRNIMEFPHSANSITDFKISITTASSRTQTFSTLSAPEDTILSREPNFQNQVSIPNRRSPNHSSSCPSTIFTWRRTSYSLGIRRCHPQDFPGPFQKPEGETPSGSFQGPSSGPSEDSFTCPGYGPQGDSCPRSGGKFVLPRGRVVRVFTQTNPNFWLAIRDGSVVLAYMNPSDKFQQWVMDDTYSTVKDEDGRPSFSLVNKATSQALKHGLGETQPVLLTQYDPNNFDESILWTTSGDMGQGFRTIRLVNNIHLNLDAFHGDKKSGGIKDGNPVVLWSWKKGDNQLWKIVPF